MFKKQNKIKLKVKELGFNDTLPSSPRLSGVNLTGFHLSFGKFKEISTLKSNCSGLRLIRRCSHD